jgi:leucyl aminopeptidase (aminopeptidase T)
VILKDLMKENGFKVISCGGLASLKSNKVNAFLEAFNHDEKGMRILNNKISNAMKKTKIVKIICDAGTNLELNIKNCPVLINDGNHKNYSTNYPVGETYTVPIENLANGIAMISSFKISGETVVPKKPIKMIFKDGIMIKSNSKKVENNLKESVKFNKRKKVKNADKLVRTIAEFAIGTNKKAQIVGAMICDEKAYGTCHIALGANKHMGGNTQCYGHFDNVIKNPTIWFDKKLIMKNGKLVI